MFENHFESLVLFPTGICNLQCKYCNIDKNPALQEIDQHLADSFLNLSYYQEQILKWFPKTNQLKSIQTWGGEPFLFAERIYPLVDWIIQQYPYFNHYFSSTNFSYPNWTDKILGLINVFNQYPEREFHFLLQLSCDGPTEINDRNRGQGTTEKCIKNFYKLLDLLPSNINNNVHLSFSIKGTLNIEDIYDLNNKDKIIEYYKFFENTFIDPVEQLNQFNISITPTIPNTAVPSPILKEDGQEFARFCKLTKEIEKENSYIPIFRYYGPITLYSIPQDELGPYGGTLRFDQVGGFCGAGVNSIGILPNNVFTSCHEGFTYMAESYKNYAAVSSRIKESTINLDNFIGSDKTFNLCMNEQNFTTFSEILSCYYVLGTTARLINLVTQIQILAMADQIDSQYVLPEKALDAASWLTHSGFGMCMKDNFNMTGSITLYDHGILKLLLNGACEYIKDEEKYI